MIMRKFPMVVAGKPRVSRFETIRNPYDGEAVSEVEVADEQALEAALAAAAGARSALRELPVHARVRALGTIASRLAERAEELARLIVAESGKPLRYARAEVARAVTTCSLGAHTAATLGGEVMPADVSAAGEGKLLMYRRVPRGVVAGIGPFNFPLNLLAHKLSPALAVGAPIVLKPPHQAPGAGHLLAELARELELPAGAVQALHAPPEVAARLAGDARVAVLSFTGSERVGLELKARAGNKQVVLELGGNAPAIVDETCDLEAALPRLIEGCWANAGQVCIKTQRLLIHASVYEEFVERFVKATRELAVGDPSDERTVVGPLIEPRHVERVLGLVREAERAGARVLCGGQASGSVVEPMVVADAAPELPLCREEVFGPVTTVEPFASFDEGLAKANATRFGLQACLFTRELGRALRAFERLDYGGVVVNQASTFRTDNYPYGGTKDSGHGREGVRFAAEEYSEPRVLVLSG